MQLFIGFIENYSEGIVLGKYIFNSCKNGSISLGIDGDSELGQAIVDRTEASATLNPFDVDNGIDPETHPIPLSSHQLIIL